jgi:hypothetical protein
MANIRIVPYQFSDVEEIIDDLCLNLGLVREFKSICTVGNFYGVVGADETVEVFPDRGFISENDVGRNKVLEFILEKIRIYTPHAKILLQDIWAKEEDYNGNIHDMGAFFVVDDSVYKYFSQNDDLSFIVNSLKIIISYTAVFSFFESNLDVGHSLPNPQSIFAFAVEAFDGQGWLVWTKSRIFV